MSLPSTFPGAGSIPPPCFYNIQGIATWLNANPTYKQYFINYPNLFPTLLSTSNMIGYQGYTTYNVQNVPLEPNVKTLSQTQLMKYTEQIKLFRNVYAYNSNAYVNYITNGVQPQYYQFKSYKERHEYQSALGIVNKMYPFNAMLNGANSAGSTLGWVIPFPFQ